jgi:hypothetical protein
MAPLRWLAVVGGLVLCAGCALPLSSESSVSSVVNRMERNLEATPVPPFLQLHLDNVKCSRQAADRVLCSGSLVKPDGTRYGRTRLLFRAPQQGDAALVPICDQGRYGITPRIHTFCAQ